METSVLPFRTPQLSPHRLSFFAAMRQSLREQRASLEFDFARAWAGVVVKVRILLHALPNESSSLVCTAMSKEPMSLGIWPFQSRLKVWLPPVSCSRQLSVCSDAKCITCGATPTAVPSEHMPEMRRMDLTHALHAPRPTSSSLLLLGHGAAAATRREVRY